MRLPRQKELIQNSGLETEPTWEPRTVTVQEFWFGDFEAKSHVAQAGLKPMMYLRVILNS